MIPAFSRAFAQMSDPTFRRILLISLLMTFAVLIGSFFAIQYSLHFLSNINISIFGWEWDIAWIVDWGVSLATLLLMFILFPVIATVFIGIFADDIALAVERRYYAHDPEGTALPLVKGIQVSLQFMLIAVAINLLVLPLYIFTIWLPLIPMLPSYSVNGLLLGREYFEMVGRRHEEELEVLRLRRRHRGRVFMSGAFIVFLLTVPIVNLIAPIVGTAAMVHIFKRTQGSRPAKQTMPAPQG